MLRSPVKFPSACGSAEGLIGRPAFSSPRAMVESTGVAVSKVRWLRSLGSGERFQFFTSLLLLRVVYNTEASSPAWEKEWERVCKTDRVLRARAQEKPLNWKPLSFCNSVSKVILFTSAMLCETGENLWIQFLNQKPCEWLPRRMDRGGSHH